MTANEIIAFTAVMEACCEYYGRKELSEAAMMIYFRALEDYSLAEVQHGISVHLRNRETGQFFPKAADIIRGIEGDSESTADQAWLKVTSAIGRVGRYQSVAFDDPLIHVCISAMGGWAKFCATDYEELKWLGKDFVRIYRGFVGQALPEYPPHLPGLCEVDNAARGYDSDPPILIGERQRVLTVMRNGVDRPALTISTLHIGETVKQLTLPSNDEASA